MVKKKADVCGYAFKGGGGGGRGISICFCCALNISICCYGDHHGFSHTWHQENVYSCILLYSQFTPTAHPPPLFSRSALYANNLYLSQYRTLHPELLASNTPGGPKIIGDVRIHPSAQIHPSAVVSMSHGVWCVCLMVCGVYVSWCVVCMSHGVWCVCLMVCGVYVSWCVVCMSHGVWCMWYVSIVPLVRG